MSNLDEVVTFPQLNKPAPNFNAKTDVAPLIRPLNSVL